MSGTNGGPDFDSLEDLAHDAEQLPHLVAAIGDFVSGHVANSDIHGPAPARPASDSGWRHQINTHYLTLRAGQNSLHASQAEIKGLVESVKGSVESVKGSVESVKGSVESVKGLVESVEGRVESVKGSVESVERKLENGIRAIARILGASESQQATLFDDLE